MWVHKGVTSQIGPPYSLCDKRTLLVASYTILDP